MKWLERLLGPSEYRRYGDNEYYEYPRNGVCRESSGSSSGSGSWEIGPELILEPSSSLSWRGPSIFEDSYADMYSTRGMSNSSYRDQSRRNNYVDQSNYHSRDVSQYVSQYGGTTEIYSPANGSFRDSAYGRKEQAPAYDHTRRYKTEDYDTRDDVLARAMQETLSLREYPGSYGTPAVAPANPVAAATTKSVGMSTCAGCHRSLGFGKFFTRLNQNWHPDCFGCKNCGKAIADNEFSVHGSDPYHRDCYKKLFHPKCEICYNHIPLNARGQIEYRSHAFWNQRYCPQHEKDGSICCCSCDRIEAVDQRYTRLEDGRKVCSDCMESAVMATKDCQPLYRDILKFFRNNLGMPIEQEVPMLLVNREALNNARIDDDDGHAHTSETRGLCLSEEQIPSVLQQYGGYDELEMRNSSRHCEVTAILVLFGLPRLLTGSILAHELMHAWIRLDGRFPDLENDTEEGICQVIAHMWLKSELETLTRRSYNGSSINKRLGEFFLHQIETDSSPIYGDGFRAASAAVAKYGLPRTLHHLRQTGEILRT
ncbi:hypothetical protein KC19_1G056900 [Ceratodon purpureus]|uniref:LIM zinc-binding domain-containing protein n=1 Tax=Ceratodon purpureus TaxID=3225 RepID=A0A8T0J4A3_CERPU|nr:hypothetical protein KC19_1G056900 [Ceratodon purpureus]KAG0589906.1 hypothetical protein KC19_1G056900 [Ceratodon purpureus]KAG0589908.1 hypothetical protein KC19_1G056900 [Ceratodon purpureus]KAG0589913.1 hypothetical protein KC19_1G056900 [Ceratodon purpureus]